jgi:hypothetical protein
MRISFGSVLVVTVCLMVLGATQVFAQQQCSICNRVTMVPVTPGSGAVAMQAKAPACGTCASMMQACPKAVWMTPTVVTTTVTPLVMGVEVSRATPAPQCAERPLYGRRRVAEQAQCPPAPKSNCVSSIFGQLKFENDQIRTLMGRLAKAEPCQYSDTYSQLRATVVAHIKAQQAVLHSPLLDCPTTRNWTLQSAEAQQAVLTQICTMDQTAPNDELWKIRFDNLNQMIGRSAFIEQEKLWPQAARLMNPNQCDSLCAAYNEQKAAALASLPTYTAVACTTFFPANCFINRTMPTSSSETGNDQQK